MNDADVSPFDLARRGETAALLQHLDRGLSVDSTDAKGDSLLMLAAYHGHAELVRALLARGADASLVDDDGYDARLRAEAMGAEETAALLDEVARTSERRSA